MQPATSNVAMRVVHRYTFALSCECKGVSRIRMPYAEEDKSMQQRHGTALFIAFHAMLVARGYAVCSSDVGGDDELTIPQAGRDRPVESIMTRRKEAPTRRNA
jgi:hypothetical protein